MPPRIRFSVPVFKSGVLLRRVTIAVAFILVTVGASWGQTSTPTPGSNARHVHWRKYVNKEYRFSLWYPDTYRPASADDVCKDNTFRRYLLCLEQGDNSGNSILVTIIIAVPFFVEPNSGGTIPTHQRIGRHVFYCGLGGSMGTGFSDECIFNLRNKTLEFNFSPPEAANSTDKPKSLAFMSLKTFRTF
jgi:hypothetical protein